MLTSRNISFQLNDSYTKSLILWSLFAVLLLPTQKAFSEKKMIPMSKKALEKADGVLVQAPKVRWSAVLPMKGTFPRVEGSNLNNQKFSLPNSFTGKLNLVMVAFQRQQQDSVNTWLPLAQRLERKYGQRLHYYELPTISRFYGLFRGFIDGGMRSGIPDLKARARTVTLYIDEVVGFGCPHPPTLRVTPSPRGRSRNRCVERGTEWHDLRGEYVSSCVQILSSSTILSFHPPSVQGNVCNPSPSFRMIRLLAESFAFLLLSRRRGGRGRGWRGVRGNHKTPIPPMSLLHLMPMGRFANLTSIGTLRLERT